MVTRLEKLRKEAGYEYAADFARKHDIPEPTYRSAENGIRPPPIAAAKRYAAILSSELKRSIHWLYLMGEISGETVGGYSEALLIGKVGAGAQVERLDHPDVLAGIPLPPDLDAPNAAIIEGDSQHPLEEGWLILYGPENQGIYDSCIGKLCVVKVKDGPTLLKTLKRGSRKGLWNLESWNAKTREDQKIEWAARVMVIRPR